MKRILLLAGLMGFVLCGISHAAIFMVTNTNDSGVGSLRDAINNANGNFGLDQIIFDIPGGGVKTIKIYDTLNVYGPVVIDGLTQGSNASCDSPRNILVEIVPADFVWKGIRFDLGSYGSRLSGVAIYGFNDTDVYINSENILLTCNNIGTNAASTENYTPSYSKVFIEGSSNVKIGGDSPNQRNVISGGNDGVAIYYSHDISIQGNYIGLNNTGDAVLPNFRGIITRFSQDITIDAGNVISGNTAGIALDESSKDIIVQKNIIGTNANGSSPLGNGVGIRLIGAEDVLIGGISGEGNLIAYNHYLGGITLIITADNLPIKNVSILGNRIHSNGGTFLDLGIDINENGVTLNDVGDIDDGPNDLLNFPVLTSAELSGTDLNVKYSLDAPQGDYRVEFFANSQMDPSGHGEGEIYLGHADVTTDAVSGLQNYNINIPISIPSNQLKNISSTTTKMAAAGFGATSEFSKSIDVVIKSFDYGDAPDAGNGTGAGNYQTTSTDDGASHKLNYKIYLGACVDADPGILQDVEAMADDTDFSSIKVGKCEEGDMFDDEDGVALPPNFPPGSTQKIYVSAFGGGYLDAWIDWNRNGIWGDTTSEKVAINQFLNSGTHQINVNVPSNTTIGFTYARFRYSTQLGLTPVGPADNGEVEDYKIKVAPQFTGGGDEIRKWSPKQRESNGR